MFTRNVQKEIKEMLMGIARSQDLDYRLVEDIFFHEFEFTSNMMERGDKESYSSYENVLLKELGSFIANEKHINKLKDIQHAKQTDDSEI